MHGTTIATQNEATKWESEEASGAKLLAISPSGSVEFKIRIHDKSKCMI